MDDKQIYALDIQALFDRSTIDSIYDEEDSLERERLKAVLMTRANELKCGTTLKRILKSYDEAEKELAAQYTKENARSRSALPLKFDGR